MTRNFLAIPAVAVAVLCALLPSRAQNFSDNSPPAQVAPSSMAGAPQTPTIGDEDLARLMLLRKDYRQAEEIFYRLTVQQPTNAIYWNELGISRHNQMELTAALKCYEKSSKLDKQYSDALNNAGTIWYERKKYAKAIRAYRKAINLRGDFAPFYLNLGFAYFNEKNYNDSIAAFRKALELDPTAFDPSRSRSGTVIQDRSMSVDRGRFYFMLAKSFAEAGNLERCLIYLKKARDEGFKELNSVKSDPAFAEVLQNPAVQEVLAPRAVEEVAQP
jgi:tetratricopeptide (TPR) repeat protein